MKLDRNINESGKGKYALINLRKIPSDPRTAQDLAAAILANPECVEFGSVGSPDEFWVIKLKDTRFASGQIDRLKRAKREVKMTGVELIAAERQRQIDVEEWTPEHDDMHTKGQLSGAAMAYAFVAKINVRYGLGAEDLKEPAPEWPWDASWWKPSDDPIRNLVKAGALIAAEIDRLQRAKDSTGTKP